LGRQQVLNGGDLYPAIPTPISISFIRRYRRFARGPSHFGKIPLYLCFVRLNAVAWWMTAQLSNAMTGSGRVADRGWRIAGHCHDILCL